MRDMRWLLLGAALIAAGCGGGGGGGAPVQPPTNQPRNEAESNDFTAQALGALSNLDFVVSGSAASNRDVDLYSVTASSALSLLVSLDWTASASDLELTISDAGGIFVRHVDTVNHPEACTLSGLPAGTYTVRVGSFTSTATSYTLTIGRR